MTLRESRAQTRYDWERNCWGSRISRANLEDLIRFKVEPLLTLIRITGLSRNVARADVYFADRVLEVQLRREQVRQRMTSCRRRYAAISRLAGRTALPLVSRVEQEASPLR